MNGGDDYPARLLRGLVGIPSVSGREQRASAYLVGQMERLGMRARVDAVGNAVGEIGAADGPTVLLLGHIDTVPGDIAVCQVGDLLYGRGTVDAKGPLAAMTCAAVRAAAAEPRLRVIVAGAVGEEVPGSRGARHLLRTLPAPDAVVIGEPSGWDGVCLGYKGRVGVEYEVSRPPMHTSSPEETAVEAAAAFWRGVDAYMRRASGPHEGVSFDAAAATLVRLDGDIRDAAASITCRVPAGFDFDDFQRFVDDTAVHAAARLDERVPAVRRGVSDPVARALRNAIRLHGGRPVLRLKAGTSDMNVIEHQWPVPMVAYGPGDAHLDHTDDEHIDLGDLHRSVAVLTRALTDLAGVLRRTPATTLIHA
ncbi:[LysW]-lysine hydrolase [Streptomyces sp. NPDC059875]|uniref:[LysW]-lysine hydrolase n=1 Tax=unclassified Streptomyces TaxID=2593676 RepID=UPI00365FF755